jgi:pyruvate formate lyase activating enzyme
MIVAGFQPLTLIDFPGTISTIVFTKGCIFRCPYCHNPELVEPETWDGIKAEEFFSFLKRRRGMLEGVVVSGGEPTLHKDLPDFIREIKQLGYTVKLDTNRINPTMVSSLIHDRLIDYVAMDIKHTWSKYQSVAQIDEKKQDQLSQCKETMDILRSSGISYEWRTTVYPKVHNEQDIREIVQGLQPGESYFLQEMQYHTTLRKLSPDENRIDISALTEQLQREFPSLSLAVR